MLELKNINKQFGNKEKELVVNALSNINISFSDSGMVFILGKSGSGKSTLLNIIGGLDVPTYGEFIISNKSSKNFGKGDFDFYRSSVIGFVFQEFNLVKDLSVKENIELALELQGNSIDDSQVRSLLYKVDLEGYENRMPNTLSGGEKQRIAIARCLAKNPKIILADEPTG